MAGIGWNGIRLSACWGRRNSHLDTEEKLLEIYMGLNSEDKEALLAFMATLSPTKPFLTNNEQNQRLLLDRPRRDRAKN